MGLNLSRKLKSDNKSTVRYPEIIANRKDMLPLLLSLNERLYNESINCVWENVMNEINESERYLARFISCLICQMFDIENEMANMAKESSFDESQLERIDLFIKKYELMSKIVNNLKNIGNISPSRSPHRNSWINEIKRELRYNRLVM